MPAKKRTTINLDKVSVKFNLKTTTPKNKLTVVIPIVRYNNEKIVLPSYFKVKPNEWNVEKQKAKITTMHDKEKGITVNSRIATLTTKIKSVFKAYTERYSKYPDPKEFKDIVVNELNKTDDILEEQPPVIDLVAFAEQFIERAEAGLRTNDRGKPLSKTYISIFRTLKASIEGFRDGTFFVGKGKERELKKYKDGKGYDVGFDNMGLDFFEDFKEYLLITHQYNTNSLSKHIRNLKILINEANQRGLTSATFTGKRYKAVTEEVDNIYLNEDELGVLYDIELRPSLDRVRDLFLVGCWTGLRFSDFTNIRSKNIFENDKGRFINIQTKKTGNKVSVPILPIVDTILKKYEGKTNGGLLPDDISNQKMNQYRAPVKVA